MLATIRLSLRRITLRITTTVMLFSFMAGIPGLTFTSGSQPQGNYSFSTPSISSAQLQQAYNSGGLTPLGPSKPGFVQGTANTQVLGAQTGPAYSPQTNNTASNQNLVNSLGNATAAQTQAQMQAAAHQYDQLYSQLEAQKPVLQSAYDLGNQGIDTAIQQSEGQAKSQSDQLNSQGQFALGLNSQNYQDAQGQNRELARALGSYGTDYAQLQNKSSNNFSNNQNQVTSDLNSRLNDVQSNLTAMHQQAQQQKAQLSAQLQQGMQQIVLDEAATDQQKADALNSLRADFSTKIASINSSLLQFQQQSQLAQQQIAAYAAMYGKAGAGFAPSQSLANLSPANIDLSSYNGSGAVGGLSDPSKNPIYGVH